MNWRPQDWKVSVHVYKSRKQQRSKPLSKLIRSLPMASSIVSSAAVASVNRISPAQVTTVAPFTGLKSTSTLPMTRKLNNDITSIASNGGRVQCMQVLLRLSNKTLFCFYIYVGNGQFLLVICWNMFPKTVFECRYGLQLEGRSLRPLQKKRHFEPFLLKPF